MGKSARVTNIAYGTVGVQAGNPQTDDDDVDRDVDRDDAAEVVNVAHGNVAVQAGNVSGTIVVHMR